MHKAWFGQTFLIWLLFAVCVSVLTCESFHFFDSAEPRVKEVVLVVCERS